VTGAEVTAAGGAVTAAGGGATAGGGEATGGDSGLPGQALAAEAVRLLIARSETVAIAESLTGGLVTAAVTSVPGCSAVFPGGIVAYATNLKAQLLGVPEDLLAEHGPVHPDVAEAMARGVSARLQATYGLATTGVAGPGPADGRPAGTVFVAAVGPGLRVVRGLDLAGGRSAVRAASVVAVLSLLVSALREDIS
jgi:nicotinamide-nucleotide amidase